MLVQAPSKFCRCELRLRTADRLLERSSGFLHHPHLGLAGGQIKPVEYMQAPLLNAAFCPVNGFVVLPG